MNELLKDEHVIQLQIFYSALQTLTYVISSKSYRVYALRNNILVT